MDDAYVPGGSPTRALLFTVCILVLQGLTLVRLMNVLLLMRRNKEFRSLWQRAHAVLCRCSERFSKGAHESTSPEVAKFHWAQCNLLVIGSRFFSLVLFFRLIMFQLYLQTDMEHLLSPPLDISSLAGYAVVLFLTTFRRTVQPKTLDFWYVVNQGLSILPIILCAPEEVYSMSLITLLPRFLVGLVPKHAWWAILGNLVHWILALKHVDFQLQSSTFAEQSAMLGIVLGGILSIRQQIFQNVKMSFDLKTRTIELEAVSSLLLGFCDAVVEVEEDTLTLTEDSRQLSTMLLHGHGISAGGLAGSEFLNFFTPEDRDHIEESLSTGSKNTLALNARMLDCLGNLVRVELLHIRFRNPNGQVCRLVGMREFQDLGSVVVQEMHSMDSAGAFIPEPVALPEDATVLFNASSFDVLAVGSGIGRLCFSRGMSLDLESGMNVFDLSKSTGPSSLSRQLQEMINSWTDEATPFTMQLENVDLLGISMADVQVTLQKDEVLNDLVGTLKVLHVVPSTPSSRLTHGNLATLNVRRTRSRSSSRSGERPRRQTSAERGTGSILELRTRAPMSL
ncbi:Uncharacterized protein SCF082_LOCUS37455 [Durusdinium trenchii]|uniref:Uncharacterized protein n=1 Tax=Durusdinium trenchii TaxID=1381693 RepID=A0ABP0PSM1_9DINO